MAGFTIISTSLWLKRHKDGSTWLDSLSGPRDQKIVRTCSLFAILRGRGTVEQRHKGWPIDPVVGLDPPGALRTVRPYLIPVPCAGQKTFTLKGPRNTERH